MSNSYDPIDCSLPGSSVHGIILARILEWVTISSSKGIFPTQGHGDVMIKGRRKTKIRDREGFGVYEQGLSECDQDNLTMRMGSACRMRLETLVAT